MLQTTVTNSPALQAAISAQMTVEATFTVCIAYRDGTTAVVEASTAQRAERIVRNEVLWESVAAATCLQLGLREPGSFAADSEFDAGLALIAARNH